MYFCHVDILRAHSCLFISLLGATATGVFFYLVEGALAGACEDAGADFYGIGNSQLLKLGYRTYIGRMKCLIL